MGDWIYIPSELYLSHGEDDVIGGLARIKQIRPEDGYLEFEGFEGTFYGGGYLLANQEKLKAEFGDQKARKNPDHRPEFNEGWSGVDV